MIGPRNAKVSRIGSRRISINSRRAKAQSRATSNRRCLKSCRRSGSAAASSGMARRQRHLPLLADSRQTPLSRVVGAFAFGPVSAGVSDRQTPFPHASARCDRSVAASFMKWVETKMVTPSSRDSWIRCCRNPSLCDRIDTRSRFVQNEDFGRVQRDGELKPLRRKPSGGHPGACQPSAARSKVVSISADPISGAGSRPGN